MYERNLTPLGRITICLLLGALAASGGDASRRFSDWSAPVNLGAVVNSELEELSPFVSADGRSLYFGSARPGGFGGIDIWVSERARVKDPWGSPRNLGSAINSPFNDGQPALSTDGRQLFFNSTRPGGLGGQDIYVARRVNRRDNFDWREAVNLGEAVNSIANDQSPLWFEDDDSGTVTLFLASNRPGGPGGDDIYASRLQPDETLGPVELIEELSSAFAEANPAIRRDGLEMIFTSDRPGTFGGLDLWASTRRSTTDSWSMPENLGPIVNSVFFDSGPALTFDGTALMFSSALRPGTIGAEGRFDLWMVTRAKARGEDGGQR